MTATMRQSEETRVVDQLQPGNRCWLATLGREHSCCRGRDYREKEGDVTAPTGPDYLLAVAERASESGQPYSSEFANMVYGAFEPSGISGIPDVPAMEFPLGQLPKEMVARRPLEEHEASPVSIVLGASEAAKDKGDAEAQIEVLRDGLTLLAKWPEYLLITTTGHPTLAFKPTEDGPADEDGHGEELRVAGLLWVAKRIEDTARRLEVEIQGLDDHRVEGVQEETHTLHWCPVESKNILTGPDNQCPACGANIIDPGSNRSGRSQRRR